MISEQNVFTVGITLIIIGFLLLIISLLFNTSAGRTRFAFVGFIGPFPIGFSNDKKLLLITVLLTLILILSFIMVQFLVRGWSH